MASNCRPGSNRLPNCLNPDFSPRPVRPSRASTTKTSPSSRRRSIHRCGSLRRTLRHPQERRGKLLAQARDAAIALYTRQRPITRSHAASSSPTPNLNSELTRRVRLHLIDEALTPDSSRFWPMDAYAVGSNPPSFDKQYVRDHLEISWTGQDGARAKSAGRSHRSHPGQVR